MGGDSSAKKENHTMPLPKKIMIKNKNENLQYLILEVQPLFSYKKNGRKTKLNLKNQTSGKDVVDTYFPIAGLTLKSVNPKVYHNAPQKYFIM